MEKSKKLTDSEIVKALECCTKSSHFGECFENQCPLVSEEGCKVGEETLYPYLLDLINRLQARIGIYETCNARKDEAIKHLENEVKRLQAENERLKTELDFAKAFRKETEAEFSLMHRKYGNMLKTAKAEAYKEFAGRLLKKELEIGYFSHIAFQALNFDTNKLLKELVGE